MSVLHNLDARIAAILSPLFINGQAVPYPVNTPAEIRLYLAQITQVEKNLRLLKTEINNESRQVSQQYTDRASHVSSHSLQGLLEGKKKAIHHSARDRQHIHHNKSAALQQYHHATANIDRRIAILDELKLKINQAKQQAAFQRPPSQPMPQPTAQPLFNYTCQFCGFQFQTPGGLVRCPRCGR